MPNANYELRETTDGSFTYFSKAYGQSYHSVKEGAVSETLYKHVIPAFKHCQDKDEIVILDICFGLGLNTLTSIWYNQEHNQKKLKIYSPELDAKLISSLKNLPYPKELQPLLPILKILVETKHYKDENLDIELFIGDAREYVRKFENFFDVVYQDAFSPDVNPMLWTVEYFADINTAIKKEGILTSYSIALPTRMALEVNGFIVYVHEGEQFRKSTLASLSVLENYDKVNIGHKRALNPNVRPLVDKLDSDYEVPTAKLILFLFIVGLTSFFGTFISVRDYIHTGSLKTKMYHQYFYDDQALFLSISISALGCLFIYYAFKLFKKRKVLLKKLKSNLML